MKTPTPQERQEKEANIFAVCLLIPEPLLREALVKYPLDLADDTNFKIIARMFQVSYTALAYRLYLLQSK